MDIESAATLGLFLLPVVAFLVGRQSSVAGWAILLVGGLVLAMMSGLLTSFV